MRTPVVSTENLSRNEIYDMKQEFDLFISKEYQKAADESSKSDIVQGMMHEGKMISINPTWEKLYRSKLHIDVFLQHMTEREQEFNKDYYIIRTFEDFKMKSRY